MNARKPISLDTWSLYIAVVAVVVIYVFGNHIQIPW